jgi:hypothetical protein
MIVADDVTWITVNGMHIPIKAGESKNDAIQRAIDYREKGGSDPGGGGSPTSSKKTDSGSESSKSKRAPKTSDKTPKKLPPDALSDSKTFDSKEISAVKDYQGTHYRDINQGMRYNKLSPENQQRVELMNKALGKSKLESDVVLYRGIPEKYANQLIKSNTMTDLGFQSTTTKINDAVEFASMGGAKYNNNVVRFTAKKGTSALNLGSGGENEILLKPSKYKFVSEKIVTAPSGDTTRFLTVERSDA